MKNSILSVALAGVLTTVPMLAIFPVEAQEQLDVGLSRLQPGTVIPIASSGEQGTQYFSNDSTHPVSLTVTQAIFDGAGQLAIPAGSVIQGELQPRQGGAQFIGTTLITNGRTYGLRATSPLINDEKDPRQYSGQAIAEDAAIGAAAGTVLGILTGGVSALGVFGGAAAGVGVGNVTAPQAVVLRPEQPINLTLESPVNLQ